MIHLGDREDRGYFRKERLYLRGEPIVGTPAFVRDGDTTFVPIQKAGYILGLQDSIAELLSLSTESIIEMSGCGSVKYAEILRERLLEKMVSELDVISRRESLVMGIDKDEYGNLFLYGFHTDYRRTKTKEFMLRLALPVCGARQFYLSSQAVIGTRPKNNDTQLIPVNSFVCLRRELRRRLIIVCEFGELSLPFVSTLFKALSMKKGTILAGTLANQFEEIEIIGARDELSWDEPVRFGPTFVFEADSKDRFGEWAVAYNRLPKSYGSVSYIAGLNEAIRSIREIKGTGQLLCRPAVLLAIGKAPSEAEMGMLPSVLRGMSEFASVFVTHLYTERFLDSSLAQHAAATVAHSDLVKNLGIFETWNSKIAQCGMVRIIRYHTGFEIPHGAYETYRSYMRTSNITIAEEANIDHRRILVEYGGKVIPPPPPVFSTDPYGSLVMLSSVLPSLQTNRIFIPYDHDKIIERNSAFIVLDRPAQEFAEMAVM